MATSQNQLIKSRNARSRVAIPVKGSTHIYQGQLVFAVAASGLADSAIATGANALFGVAAEEKDNSSGSDGDLKVECFTEGEFELQGSGFTQALVGDKIYASDNFTVTGTSTNNTLIGRCTEYVSSTKIMVKLEPGTQA